MSSDRSLQREYAKWLAAKMLDLRLVTSNDDEFIDATDGKGSIYKLKLRTVKPLENNASFDFPAKPCIPQMVPFLFDLLGVKPMTLV